MRKLLPISITEGKVTKVYLEYDDVGKKLGLVITLQLQTSEGEVITEITLGTDAWRDRKVTLPPSIIPLAGKIRELCEVECIRAINSRRKALPPPKEEDIF